MKLIKHILLFVFVLVLCWIGYIMYDVYYVGKNLIGSIVPIVSALTSLIIMLALNLTFRETKKFNSTSLLLGFSSLTFVIVMFLAPQSILSLWNYAMCIFVLFIAHSLFILSGANEGGFINKIAIGVSTLVLLTILIFKLEFTAIHIIAMVFCAIATFTNALSVFGKKI